MKKLLVTGMAGVLVAVMAIGCAKEKAPSKVPTSAHALGRQSATRSLFGGPGALYELLDLTEAQRTHVAKILEANAPRNQSRKTAGETRGKKRRQKRGAHTKGLRQKNSAGMHTQNNPVHQEIMSLLTPAQKKRAEALKAQLDTGIIPQELIDLQVKKLTDLLALSTDQQKQVATIVADRGKAFFSRRKGAHSQGTQRHPQNLDGRYREAFKALLSESQWETWSTHLQHHFKGRSGALRGTQSPMRAMMNELNLTDVQKEQIHDILQTMHTKTNLPHGDPQKMRAHHDALKTKISALLTPAQQEKFNAMKPPHAAERSRRRNR